MAPLPEPRPGLLSLRLSPRCLSLLSGSRDVEGDREEEEGFFPLTKALLLYTPPLSLSLPFSSSLVLSFDLLLSFGLSLCLSLSLPLSLSLALSVSIHLSPSFSKVLLLLS